MDIGERILYTSRIREKDGLKYPSVTSVLKLAPNPPKYQKWMDFVGMEEAMKVMTLASGRGEIAHKYLQDYYTGIKSSYDVNYFVDKLGEGDTNKAKAIKKMQGFVTAANRFLALYGNTISVSPENIEKEMFFTVPIRGKEYRLSGRLDFLPDRFMSYQFPMMDFKTKSAIHIEELERERYGMQLALYIYGAFKELNHYGIIVILAENGACSTIEYSPEEIKKYFNMACNYVQQYYLIANEVNFNL